MERTKAIVTILITAVVNIANVYGYAIDAEPYVTAITSVLSALSIAYAWWRNNNITYAAQQGQLVVNRIKDEQRALKMKRRQANDE